MISKSNREVSKVDLFKYLNLFSSKTKPVLFLVPNWRESWFINKKRALNGAK